MPGLIFIIIATAILMALACIGLVMGIALISRRKLADGLCGWDPSRKRDGKCGEMIVCPVCYDENDKAKIVEDDEEEE